jgi:hypothetical protein
MSVQPSANKGKLFLNKRDDGWYWTAYGRECGPFVKHYRAFANYGYFMRLRRQGREGEYTPKP